MLKQILKIIIEINKTNIFNISLGHSFFARKKLEDFFIGNLKEEDHIVYQNQYTKGRFENMEIQISIGNNSEFYIIQAIIIINVASNFCEPHRCS